MFRTGLILALAAAAWSAGGSRCAGQYELPPGTPAPTIQEGDAPPGEPWPAGTLETQAHTSLDGWMADHPLAAPALPVPVFALPGFSPAPGPYRAYGLGCPLTGTSWLNRPWHLGGYFGGMQGDDLIDGELDQDVGLAAGFRGGYDFHHYWGCEARITYAHAAIDDAQNPPPARHVNEWYFDGDLLYYPWGDSMWRPYLSVGGGAASFRFLDGDGAEYEEWLFQVPLGVGVKYFFDRWLALRADLTHNVVIGAGGLGTMDNFSATAGLEFHFGARPRSYYPW